MEAQYQNFALPQRRKTAQFHSIDSAARSMPLEQLYDFSVGASNAFYSIPYYQNPISLTAQSQWMCPSSASQPTFNVFEEWTQYGLTAEASSSYSDSTDVASPELQQYNRFLDDNYKNQNPITSTMPLQEQLPDANFNACGTLSMATSSQTPAGYFLCSLTSTSPGSAPVAPSYEDQDQGALSSRSSSREVLTTATNSRIEPWHTIPGVDIDPNPIEWLNKTQEKMLLSAANRGTNITTPPSDARGHLNVPVFDLSRIDACYSIPLGSMDQATQLPSPVSLNSCLQGRVDNPDEFVFDGWEPGFFTLYMVYNEKQKKPKLVRIATELEDGRKMRKVHLAYLIAREYAKIQLELELKGFPLFMNSAYPYAGECSRVDFSRIKITHIEIDRTSSIGYPNIVIGYSATPHFIFEYLYSALSSKLLCFKANMERPCQGGPRFAHATPLPYRVPHLRYRTVIATSDITTFAVEINKAFQKFPKPALLQRTR
ncbi:hypothetical protein BJ912DRAFT_931262 [Pholiota molesta]|nr:hypothetical protein BJ912DRAFT_931262 [Pholiota molesta]